MARDWQTLANSLTGVAKLVFDSMKLDTYDQEAYKVELLRERRRYYEAELTNQAARVGCPGRMAYLTNGYILAMLEEQSRSDAESVVNSYNYDLAVAIANIQAENPNASRYVYAKALKEWTARRSSWKDPQIGQAAEMSVRAAAQQDFYTRNENVGLLLPLVVATLEPRTAVCPICQGWINRGIVPGHVALNNPGRWHPNCPHYWLIVPMVLNLEQCSLLWMGQ